MAALCACRLHTRSRCGGAGGQVGVVGEVSGQLAGAGGCEDDVLDAGVVAVEVEDVALALVEVLFELGRYLTVTSPYSPAAAGPAVPG